jgi:hypothetical protein
MNKRLIIIEDQLEMANNFYEDMNLNGISHKVQFLSSPEEVETVLNKLADHTAFLVDIHLGPKHKMGGIQIIKMIREKLPNSLVIVYTAYADLENLCIESGASLFKTKNAATYDKDIIQIGRTIGTYLHAYRPKSVDDRIPKVFISYSWDKVINNKEWVLELARYLENNGIDVLLDQYLDIGRNFRDFIDYALENADKVIIVFTKEYKFKAEKEQKGVGYEFSIITEDLWKNRNNEVKIDDIKYIPILREGTRNSSVPKFMNEIVFHDMTNEEEFITNCEMLLWFINNKSMKDWVNRI